MTQFRVFLTIDLIMFMTVGIAAVWFGFPLVLLPLIAGYVLGLQTGSADR